MKFSHRRHYNNGVNHDLYKDYLKEFHKLEKSTKMMNTPLTYSAFKEQIEESIAIHKERKNMYDEKESFKMHRNIKELAGSQTELTTGQYHGIYEKLQEYYAKTGNEIYNVSPSDLRKCGWSVVSNILTAVGAETFEEAFYD